MGDGVRPGLGAFALYRRNHCSALRSMPSLARLRRVRPYNMNDNILYHALAD